jgi:hypothetical protein
MCFGVSVTARGGEILDGVETGELSGVAYVHYLAVGGKISGSKI